jgi:hypothetical protein
MICRLNTDALGTIFSYLNDTDVINVGSSTKSQNVLQCCASRIDICYRGLSSFYRWNSVWSSIRNMRVFAEPPVRLPQLRKLIVDCKIQRIPVTIKNLIVNKTGVVPEIDISKLRELEYLRVEGTTPKITGANCELQIFEVCGNLNIENSREIIKCPKIEKIDVTGTGFYVCCEDKCSPSLKWLYAPIGCELNICNTNIEYACISGTKQRANDIMQWDLTVA